MNDRKVSRVNPHNKPVDGPGAPPTSKTPTPPPPPAAPMLPASMTALEVMANELSANRSRIDDLERQLAEAHDKRATLENERHSEVVALHRELTEAREAIGRLETELKNKP